MAIPRRIFGGDFESWSPIADPGPQRPNGAEVEFTVRDLPGEPPAVRALHDGLLDALAPAGALRYTPNAEEVSEARWVDQAELAGMMDDTDNCRFSPWFSAFYKQNWVKQWWENLDQLQKFKDIGTEIHPVSPINNSLSYSA